MGSPKRTTRKERAERVASWLKWHPNNPILSPEETRTFLDSIEEVKPIDDPTSKVGDTVEALVPNLHYAYNVYQCPFCEKVYSSDEAMQKHIEQVKEQVREMEEGEAISHPIVEKKDFKELQSDIFLKRARVYYEVVRPEETLPIPSSVEYSDEHKRIATPKAREQHDLDMREWREHMKATNGKRKAVFPILPHGSLQEKGGKGWWYWTVQIWNEELKMWLPMPVKLVNSVPEKVRVLCLIAIVPDE